MPETIESHECLKKISSDMVNRLMGCCWDEEKEVKVNRRCWGLIVLCIMHIYAHILAVEDDEAGRRGFHKLRGPYLCKYGHSRYTLYHFPCRSFVQQIDFVRVWLESSNSIRYQKRKGRRGETKTKKEVKKIKRDSKKQVAWVDRESRIEK